MMTFLDTIKYYVKYTFYSIASTICSLICLPYLCLRPRNAANLAGCSNVFKHISPCLGLSYDLRGMKNLQKNYTCIIVANHQSSIDILGMYEIWKFMNKTTVISRMLLLFAGPFGICAWLAGLIFINKNSTDGCVNKINEAVEYLKAKKTKLWVFPEGFRNHSGTITDFKKGAFHMAIRGQVPIIPVVFSSYNKFLNPKEKIFNSGKIIIEALEEIPTSGLKSSDVNQLMEKTRNIIVEKFNGLNKEL